MDFFKSILSDETDPKSPPKPTSDQPSSSATSATSVDGGGGWSFGGLMKTLATQSESVIEIYRRDLKEFGSGLQKETAALRDVAGRLPAEIDGVLKSTAEIISHGKDSLLLSPRSSDPNNNNPSNLASDLGSRRFNRFESQLHAIESDLGTYCNEPEDMDDFDKWKLGFVLEDREGNETVEGVYERIVPDIVDDETFWLRYYYKVHKLRMQESVRANLVKRAISVDLDEELSWDVDDDEEEEEEGDDSVVVENDKKNKVLVGKNDEKVENVMKNEVLVSEVGEKGENVTDLEKRGSTSETTPKKEDDVEIENPVKNVVVGSEIEEKGEDEMVSEKGIDNSESSKIDEKVDSDLSIVSTQPSLPEEDMGWDEIEEDVGSGDERREKPSGSPNMDELRKRLSVAEEEDEDLSWDIEDDDEPVAAK